MKNFEEIFKMKVRLSGKIIDVKVCNWFEKFAGLMFCRREKAKALLFEFKSPTKIKIHSFFVFFPFIAIWFNSEDKIVDLRVVKPFTFSVSSKKSFSKIVEIPINGRYEKILNFVKPLNSQSHSSLD